MLGQYAFKPSAYNIPHGGMPKNVRESMGLRQVLDLGLWCVDRSKWSCLWRTKACARCFNLKCMVYKHTKAAHTRGGKDDVNWDLMSPESFKGLNRTRFFTRGDFPDIQSIEKAGECVALNPMTLFWIVTRSHQLGIHGNYERNDLFLKALEKNIKAYDNSRLMLSLDRYIENHWEALRLRGHSTIYFDFENKPPEYINKPGSNVVKCRKTWTKLISPTTGRSMHPKMVCKTCRSGCFGKKRVDVWLNYHR